MRPKAALILPTPSPWLAQALQTQGEPGSGQRGPRLTRVAFGLLRVASFREDVIHDLGACGSHRSQFPAVDNLTWCTRRTPRRRRRSRGAMAGSGAEGPRRENAHRVPLTSAAPVTAKTAPSPNQPDTRSSPGRVTYAGRAPGVMSSLGTACIVISGLAARGSGLAWRVLPLACAAPDTPPPELARRTPASRQPWSPPATSASRPPSESCC